MTFKMTTASSMLLAVMLFISFVAAAPAASMKQRDVVDPPVTAPNATSVWVVGSTQTVVWDTSNLPSQITSSTGTVLLGFVNDTTGNEHLMIDNPLATGFDITVGHVDIVVPNVESRSDYVIALLGDSGNISPKFSISGSSPSSSGSTESSSTLPASISTATSTTPDQSFTTVAATSTGLSGSVALSETANTLTAVIPSMATTTSPVLSTSTAPISSGSTTGSTSASSSSPTAATNNAAPRIIGSGLAGVIIPLVAFILVI